MSGGSIKKTIFRGPRDYISKPGLRDKPMCIGNVKAAREVVLRRLIRANPIRRAILNLGIQSKPLVPVSISLLKEFGEIQQSSPMNFCWCTP